MDFGRAGDMRRWARWSLYPALFALAALASLALMAATAAAVEPPVNTSPPSIAGKAKEESVLTAKEGKWTGAESYAFQWLRCSGTCKPIEGATHSEYTVSYEDVGVTLKVIVTASNGAGHTSVESAPTGVVTDNPPKSTSKPTIAGEARVGRVWRHAKGGWAGSQAYEYRYHWELCTTESENTCTPISEETPEEYGATKPEYRPGLTEEGHYILMKETEVTHAGEVSATSAPSPRIEPGSPLNVTPPTITGEGVMVGLPMTAHPGTWAGSQPISFSYEWLECAPPMYECMTTATVGSTYTPTSFQVGDKMAVKVTATGAVSPSASATSELTGAVKGDGTVAIGWGEDAFGNLGTLYRSGRENYHVPVASPVRELMGVSAGLSSGYGLLGGGEVIAFGANGKGQLGDNSKDHSYFDGLTHVTVEQKVGEGFEPIKGIVSVVGAGTHALALNENQEVLTWGNNGDGQLGIGHGGFESETHRPTNSAVTVEALLPAELAKEKLPAVSAISGELGTDYAILGSYSVAGQGEVMGWGTDDWGETGTDKKYSEHECHNEQGYQPCVQKPELVVLPTNPEPKSEAELQTTEDTPLTGVREVTGLEQAGLALLGDGEVMAWGDNALGVMGRGRTEMTIGNKTKYEYAAPVLAATSEKPLTHVKEIASGGEHALALLKDGEVVGWGSTAHGELGAAKPTECGGGSVEQEETRQTEFEREKGEEFTRGEWELPHPCVRAATQVLAPEALGSEIVSIWAGQNYNAALTASGRLYTWGDDQSGQLGHVTASHTIKHEDIVNGEVVVKSEAREFTATPEEVPLPGAVRSLAAGGKFILALMAEGVEAPAPLITATKILSGVEPEIELDWAYEVIGAAGDLERFGPKRLTWHVAHHIEPGEENGSGSDELNETGKVNEATPPTVTVPDPEEIPEVGKKVSAFKGRWDGERRDEGKKGIAYSYEWQVCDEVVNAAEEITVDRFHGGHCEAAPPCEKKAAKNRPPTSSPRLRRAAKKRRSAFSSPRRTNTKKKTKKGKGKDVGRTPKKPGRLKPRTPSKKKAQAEVKARTSKN